MSNEIEMYVQDKEGTKNEIHFIINDVICWGKRCSLNTKEQLKNAGFEIHLFEEKIESEEDNEEVIIPESTELEDGNKTDTDSNSAPLEGVGNEPQIVGFRQLQEDVGEVDPKFQESIKNDVALNEEIPENKEEEDEEYDEDREIEAQKQQEYLSSQEENN
jgi:hypothetical protein